MCIISILFFYYGTQFEYFFFSVAWIIPYVFQTSLTTVSLCISLNFPTLYPILVLRRFLLWAVLETGLDSDN